MSRVNRFIQSFFWFAFAAFLTASIAHVAFFFRAFEPQNDGRDLLWWGVSYAIAASIDITIFLLSVTVASLHRARRTGGLIFSVWVFIAGLTVLSFYINYKYAQHFSSLGMISPTALALPWVGSIGDINPYIASMFQVLAVAYTWIADKIVSDEVPASPEQMKAEADRLEQEAIQKKRIAIAKRNLTEETGGLIGSIGNVARRAKRELKDVLSEGKEPGNVPGLPADTSQLLPGELPISEEQNVSKAEENTDASSPTFAPDPSPAGEQETGELVAITGYDVIASWVSTGRKSATIEEVSQAINLSVKVLKRRVSKGILKTTPRNPDLILLASVLDWLRSEQSGSKTKDLPAVKLVQNGHSEELITDTFELVDANEKAS